MEKKAKHMSGKKEDKKNPSEPKSRQEIYEPFLKYLRNHKFKEKPAVIGDLRVIYFRSNIIFFC